MQLRFHRTDDARVYLFVPDPYFSKSREAPDGWDCGVRGMVLRQQNDGITGYIAVMSDLRSPSLPLLHPHRPHRPDLPPIPPRLRPLILRSNSRSLPHPRLLLPRPPLHPPRHLLSASTRLHFTTRTVFAHPLPYKTTHDLIKGVSLFGYKRAGIVKATDPTLRPDSTEFFNIAKDHLHAITPSRSYPAEITEKETWILLQTVAHDAHKVGMLVLRVLATQLGIPPTSFTRKNEFAVRSGDHVRLTHKPARVSDSTTAAIGLPSHTDFGSVILLFNWLGGLQIQSYDPSTPEQWDFVRPVDGTAIINLGDAMVTFTNGVLKSAKHHVVDAPGEQGRVDRYSVVYFVRPHDEAVMEAVEGFEHLGGKGRVAGKFEAKVGGGAVGGGVDEAKGGAVR
ncbi:hypothetical protein PMIN02_012016 [Paraphaeosphaeria minitans]